jgi:hypothetical protein
MMEVLSNANGAICGAYALKKKNRYFIVELAKILYQVIMGSGVARYMM